MGIQTVFFLSDVDIVDESFLEDVGSFLNNAEVDHVVDHDDIEHLRQTMLVGPMSFMHDDIEQ